MLIRLFFLFAFTCSFFIQKSVLAQKYIADTLTANFSEQPNNRFISAVKFYDYRPENPKFISVYEKNKWLFFPVDQIVLANKPVTQGFITDSVFSNNDKYIVDIHEFYINYNERLFKRSLSLDGSLQLSKLGNNTDTSLMGMFYYEYSKRYKKKIRIEQAYSDLLKHFTDTFAYDVNVICSDSLDKINASDYNFRTGVKAASKNLYMSTDFYYGYTFWGFDAELWFSSPEPAKNFKRNSRMFRYLNYGNRQSVAFSAGINLVNYRFNQYWLLQNKSAFLFGFNKWSDIDKKKRTLEELFLLQYTMTQRISFNRLDKSGFTIGGGMIEEISYVIYNKPIIGVGVVLTCAYKF